MFEMLDIRIDVVFDSEKQQYECCAAVWDGPQYVASKVWVGEQPADLLRMITPFWLYWSALYYDSPKRTPTRYSKDGFEQLLLWDTDSEK